MFLFLKENKFIESFSSFLHKNVADDILFLEHFTDLDYLDRFSTYERFCEPRYL